MYLSWCYESQWRQVHFSQTGVAACRFSGLIRVTGIWRTGKWRIAPIRSHATLGGIYPANSLNIAINWVTVCQRRCFSCPALSSHNIDELFDFRYIFWCELTNNNTNDYKNKNSDTRLTLVSKSSIFVSITLYKNQCQCYLKIYSPSFSSLPNSVVYFPVRQIPVRHFPVRQIAVFHRTVMQFYPAMLSVIFKSCIFQSCKFSCSFNSLLWLLQVNHATERVMPKKQTAHSLAANGTVLTLQRLFS